MNYLNVFLAKICYRSCKKMFNGFKYHKGAVVMNRVYNFSAGPSMLPLKVLERAAAEMVCYGESGDEPPLPRLRGNYSICSEFSA